MDVDQLIREAARKVAGDRQAAALFECLRPHLLNPDHDVGSMLRACRASRSARRRLTAILGPLKTWVTRLRMTEAARRVRDTRDTDETIGRRLGYSTERSFRRAFRRIHGVTPHEMRLEARAPRAAASETGETAERTGRARASSRRRSTPRERALRRRRRAVLGLLDPAAAGELRAGLRRRHPGLDRRDAGADPGPGGPRRPAAAIEQAPVTLTAAGDDLEGVVAGAVLDRIFDQPDPGQRFALLQVVRCAHPASFFRFFDRCLGMVAADPEGAVASAELGVRWVEHHRESMAERAGVWQALAWTRLGRVHAQLGDSGGAERCLAAARAELGERGWEPGIEAELCRVDGLVRKLERRWDEAVRAVDRAVELTRRRGEGDLDRWQMLFQRLELAAAMGDAEAGLAFAAELEGLLDAWPEAAGERLTTWRGFVSYQRGKAHAAAGEDPHAEHFLRRALDEIAADPECDDGGELGILFTLTLHELSRVGSRIGRPGDAESVMRQALERYRWLGVPLLEAAAEAELALLCALRGGWAEARRLALAAAEFLDDLPFHREAWHAARRLRTLAEAGARPERELERLLAQLRRDLDLVAWEIPAPQAVAATRARLSRWAASGEERASGADGSTPEEAP